jgi:hypothetical protein
VPTMDALLSAHVRWLEMVSRETTAVAGRRPTLSLIPAPVYARTGGRYGW